MKKLLLNPIILFSATSKESTNCGEFLIYISVDKINAARITVEEWKQNNIEAGVNINNYICEETETILTTDLELMVNDKVEIAQWLSTNTIFIDFERNYNNIEKAHFLNPDNKIELEYINEAENNIANFYFESKSLQALKDNYGIDIYKPNYTHFIEVKKTTEVNIASKISIASMLKYNVNCFSSALISAIVFENLSQPIDLTEHSICNFLFTILNSGRIVVKYDYHGSARYYDYSTKPH